MKINNLILCFLLLSVTLVYSQDIKTSKLKGKWVAFKKTTAEGDDGSDFTLDGKPYTIKLSMHFLDDKRVRYKEGDTDYIVNYKLKGKNKLVISSREYSFIKMSDDEMVLREEKLLGGVIYFRKNKK